MKKMIICDKCGKKFISDIFAGNMIHEESKFKLVCDECAEKRRKEILKYIRG